MKLGHVVQQMQGRVKATGYVNGLPVNEDDGLEREADEVASNYIITSKTRWINNHLKHCPEPRAILQFVTVAGTYYGLRPDLYKAIDKVYEEKPQNEKVGVFKDRISKTTVKVFHQIINDFYRENKKFGSWKDFYREVWIRNVGYQAADEMEKLKKKSKMKYIKSTSPVKAKANQLTWPMGRWLRGDTNKHPDRMNCWETVLYALVRTRLVDKNYITWANNQVSKYDLIWSPNLLLRSLPFTNHWSYSSMYMDQALEPTPNPDKRDMNRNSYYMLNGNYADKRLTPNFKPNKNIAKYTWFTKDVFIPRGKIVYFGPGTHVAMTTGNKIPIKKNDAISYFGRRVGTEILENDAGTEGVTSTTLEDILIEQTYSNYLLITDFPVCDDANKTLSIKCTWQSQEPLRIKTQVKKRKKKELKIKRTKFYKKYLDLFDWKRENQIPQSLKTHIESKWQEYQNRKNELLEKKYADIEKRKLDGFRAQVAELKPFSELPDATKRDLNETMRNYTIKLDESQTSAMEIFRLKEEVAGIKGSFVENKMIRDEFKNQAGILETKIGKTGGKARVLLQTRLRGIKKKIEETQDKMERIESGRCYGQ